MRRMTAAIVALLLLLSMAAPAFAAETVPGTPNAGQPASRTVPTTAEQKPSWPVYVILGTVILGADAALIILIRKMKRKPRQEHPAPAPVIRHQEPSWEGRVLIGVSGPLEDRSFALKEGKPLFIGRDKSRCQILFEDGTPGVSSVHCVIRFDGDSATITDLNSSYGTFVDHKRLAPNVTTRLHRGLAVDIGSENNRFTLQ